jgi:hypothetical protein
MLGAFNKITMDGNYLITLVNERVTAKTKVCTNIVRVFRYPQNGYKVYYTFRTKNKMVYVPFVSGTDNLVDAIAKAMK